MYRLIVSSYLFVLVSAFPTVAAAGCWECSSNDRCEQVASGEDGHEGCYSWQHCQAGTVCEDECDTVEDACTGSELPNGPESQGLKIDNGSPLEIPYLPHHTTHQTTHEANRA